MERDDWRNCARVEERISAGLRAVFELRTPRLRKKKGVVVA